MDYQQLIAETIADPAAAFTAALDSDDAVAVAMVSIVDTSTEAPTAVARLEAFASRYGATAVTAELFLVILEQTAHLADELIEAATDQLRDKRRELPMNDKLAARAQALVSDRDAEDVQRSLLLAWMSWHARKKARKASESLLREADEPYSRAVRTAIGVMGSQSDSKARALLKEYAERHLEDSPPDP